MTTIRTNCPTCGEVDMRSEAISLQVAPTGDEGNYAFTCPECLEEVSRRATRKTVALLVAAGVEIRPREDAPTAMILPAEDRAPMPDAPVFTLDDVIAFHYQLEDDRELSGLFA
jgi:hypothetical protein